jgi:hypothetical protein
LFNDTIQFSQSLLRVVLMKFAINNLRPFAGFGVGYPLNPEECLNRRVDAGSGKQSQGTYVNLGEAF